METQKAAIGKQYKCGLYFAVESKLLEDFFALYGSNPFQNLYWTPANPQTTNTPRFSLSLCKSTPALTTAEKEQELVL